MTRDPRQILTMTLAVALALVGCGKKDGSAPGSGPAANVEEALARLGVDIDAGPRLNEDGAALPDDFTPIGPNTELMRTEELLLIGVTAEDPNAPGSFLPGELAWLEAEGGNTTLMHTVATDPVWVSDPQQSRAFAQSRRAVVGAEIDVDGYEETVVAFVQPSPATGDPEITVAVYDDALGATPFATSETIVFTAATIRDVRATAADTDGDGDDDIVLAISDGTQFTFLFVTNDDGTLSLNTAAGFSIAPLTPAADLDELSTSLATARLDHDAGEEIVATLIEHDDSQNTGIARYLILDDENRGFDTLASDYITAFGQGTLHAAVAADVTTGDLDGDGLDEILLGGLARYDSICASVGTVFVALDDAESDFRRIGEGYDEEFWSECEDFNPWQHRWAHVGLFDIDADRVPEVFVGRTLYEDFVNAAPFTVLGQIPQSAFLEQGNFGWRDRNTTDIATGDFTGDGFGEIALYAQNRDEISFWGLVNGSFGYMGGHPVTIDSAQDPSNPVLHSVNVDNDGIMLSWNRDYKLVFTEPIIIAALAAPPCFNGIGQNLDGCVTTFGTVGSETQEFGLTLSQEIKGFAGMSAKDPVTDSGPQLKITLSAKLSASIGSSYTLSQSLVYTSGPMEDSIVFTTIPYDTYTYTILTHPDPTAIGEEMVVAIPREPINLMAERNFYNGAVTEAAARVDSDVFGHTIGDPRSYPTESEANATLAANDGLKSEVATVGQGAGSTELGLSVGEAYSVGAALELGFEMELEVTAAGTLYGFSLGASIEASMTYSSGTETSYTGAVGSIPAESFGEEHLYNFGLHTYVHEDAAAGQEFEVVNYWVE